MWTTLCISALVLINIIIFYFYSHRLKQQIKTRESRLLLQSHYDTSTDLPNRSYFFNYLNQKLAKSEQLNPFSVVTIGIDRFPQFNHALGYQISDRLMRHIATRLKSHFVDAEILARFSSYIFIMVLPNKKPEDTAEIAEAILGLFAIPFSVYTVSVDVDAFVGISYFPQDAHEAVDLCQKADLALYQARYASERYLHYVQEQDPHHLNKLSLMSELRDGLNQNEFEILYQPKVTLATGKTHQVEALIRWQHHTKGAIPLTQFLPLAEETGHIKKLTEWVLDNAVKQILRWQDEGITLTVAVNLSIKDVLNKKLPDYVRAILQNSQINPEKLVFEITESTLMVDEDNAIKAIKKFHDLGIGFSIDDYGTGYSSLSYLKKLPIKEIKIDKSFTEDMLKSDKVKQIVKSTIQLGHSIDLQVVAEGIDDPVTLALLKEYQCHLGQGFLFSEPLSVKDLAAWLKS